jgi:sigma-B regulation protein RsbU (phosphoserine phosphatase)
MVYHQTTGSVSRLDGPGLVLGVEPEFAFTANRRNDLVPGDVIFIGTDGIHETRNSKAETFSLARIETILKEEAHNPPHVIRDRITGAITAFRGQQRQEDDITLVLIKVR